MRTDELIKALAANDAALGHQVPIRVQWVVAAGVLCSVALCVVFWGVLTQLPTVMQTPQFIAKISLGLATAALALLVWQRLLKPGQHAGKQLALVAAPAAAVWLWALIGTNKPVIDQAMGGMWATCSISIAALAAPVWLGLMWHAKQHAPTALRQAGAVSGAIAGGLGASVYSLYCPIFDAGYIAVWYVLGMACCVGFGALVGPRAMRW